MISKLKNNVPYTPEDLDFLNKERARQKRTSKASINARKRRNGWKIGNDVNEVLGKVDTIETTSDGLYITATLNDKGVTFVEQNVGK